MSAVLPPVAVPGSEGGVDQFVPGVGDSREAPVAAVLPPCGGPHPPVDPVNRRVPVLAEAGQPRHVQQDHRELHPPDDLLDYPHLWRVAAGQGGAAAKDWLGLAVAGATGVPISTPGQRDEFTINRLGQKSSDGCTRRHRALNRMSSVKNHQTDAIEGTMR